MRVVCGEGSSGVTGSVGVPGGQAGLPHPRLPLRNFQQFFRPEFCRETAIFLLMIDPSKLVNVVLPLLSSPPAVPPQVCDRLDLRCRFEQMNDMLEGLSHAVNHSSVLSTSSGSTLSLQAAPIRWLGGRLLSATVTFKSAG